jgi:hypothetical protein
VPLQIEELPVPRALIGHRPYLHGLFPAGGKLLLHYASPGLLVQYDLVSREAERLLVSERAFLGFDASPQGLVVTSEQETLKFDRGDQGVRERAAARAPTVLESVSDGTLRVRTAEREVEISLTPRSQGMSVTALSTVFDGAAIVGASYWNHWVFTIDPVRRSVVGRGELPGGWGEFFVAADRAAQVVIPSYQGDVYLFDLRAADRDPHLPEQWLFRVLKVPDAHFGLAMALGEGDRLYYSTHPNYNQRGGMLVCLMPDLTAHVRERLDADTTIAALVFSGGVLYGATTQARGLGLGSPDSPGLPPSVLALSSDDLSTLSSARCGTDNTDSIEAMIPAGDGRLLAGTRKGRLFLVETGRTPLACHQAHSFGLLRQPIRRMIPLDPVHALIVTNSALFVYEWSSGRLSFLVRLPIKVRFAALVSTGDLYLATRGEIFVLPAAVLSRRLPGARAAGSASGLRLRRVLNTGGSP